MFLQDMQEITKGDSVIIPTLNLYRYAVKHNVAVFYHGTSGKISCIYNTKSKNGRIHKMDTSSYETE